MIVADKDFDGIISAYLASKVYGLGPKDICFTTPHSMKSQYREGTIIVDLPYRKGCTHYDHHPHSSSLPKNADNHYGEAPSTAQVLLDTHQELEKYQELVEAANRVDTAQFLHEKEKRPEYTISQALAVRQGRDQYRSHIINLLDQGKSLKEISQDKETQLRCLERSQDMREKAMSMKHWVRTVNGVRFLIVNKNSKHFQKGVIFHIQKQKDCTTSIIITGNKDTNTLSIARPRSVPDFDDIITSMGGKAHSHVGKIDTPKKSTETTLKELMDKVSMSQRWTKEK